MPRVFRLPAGVSIAPMPELRRGEKDRVLPGGLRPRDPHCTFANLAGVKRPTSARDNRLASPTWYDMERRARRGEIAITLLDLV